MDSTLDSASFPFQELCSDEWMRAPHIGKSKSASQSSNSDGSIKDRYNNILTLRHSRRIINQSSNIYTCFWSNSKLADRSSKSNFRATHCFARSLLLSSTHSASRPHLSSNLDADGDDEVEEDGLAAIAEIDGQSSSLPPPDENQDPQQDNFNDQDDEDALYQHLFVRASGVKEEEQVESNAGFPITRAPPLLCKSTCLSHLHQMKTIASSSTARKIRACRKVDWDTYIASLRKVCNILPTSSFSCSPLAPGPPKPSQLIFSNDNEAYKDRMPQARFLVNAATPSAPTTNTTTVTSPKTGSRSGGGDAPFTSYTLILLLFSLMLLVLGGVIGLTYLIRNRRRARAKHESLGRTKRYQALESPDQTSFTKRYIVVYDYVPNLPDEVGLMVGDIVEFYSLSEDRWGDAKNLTSLEEGKACVLFMKPLID